jgi:putative transposase
MPTKYTERKILRLQGFDYSQAGAYFVTICAFDKKCIFGNIVDTHMNLNKTGQIITAAWENLPKIYSAISLDHWVIMPNHLHGIIWLEEKHSGKKNLSAILSSFKALSTIKIQKIFGKQFKLWQRSFYEHIIRDEKDLVRIRQYIEDNPAQWQLDKENPDFYNWIR